jgi:CBS-domain-containing membrane protein
MDLLLSTPVTALVPKNQKLVALRGDASVEAALALLKDTGISFVPVTYNSGAGQPDTVSGVTFSDFVRVLVAKDFQQGAFLSTPISEVVHKHMTILVTKDTSVATLLDRFVKNRPYNIVIVDDQQISAIISPSDLVHFLFDHRTQLIAPLLEQDLLHLAQLGSPVHESVHESTSIREAVTQLARSKLHAVAVVNEAGAMKACLTPPSFRSLSSTHWPDFSAPSKTAEVLGRDPGWVVPEMKLGDLLGHIVNHNLHRVWIIGDDEKPKVIITLTDILLLFYSHISNKPLKTKHSKHNK